MFTESFIYLILLTTFIHIIVVKSSSEITIATCNLWNVMFNYETRIRRIADLARQHELDIIVFQEVRLNGEGNTGGTQLSQLNEFRPFLPEYKWILATSAGTVTNGKNSYKKQDWNNEGLGVMSRRQIIYSNVIKLKQTSFKDHNKRIALHVRLKLGVHEDDFIDVVVVHFSYDPQQQCQNANDVIKIIDGGNSKRVIVLGDFNAYESETPPVNLFIKRDNSGCPTIGSEVIGSMKDAWLDAGNNHSVGLTFSNMPTPGLQSRPDRILVSKSIQVLNAGIDGDGLLYRQDYYIPILFSRASAVIKTSYEAFNHYQGYSCLHDCGPHGSCRCGVCVTGGNENNCDTPKCPECNHHKFVIFLLFLIPTIISCTVFLLALVRILVVSARFSQKDIQEILGYRCCLFNRQLFHTRVFPRRFRINVSNCLQLYHLPPVWVILAASIFLMFLFVGFKFCFRTSVDLIYSILPEEHFPSDHRIVYAKLSI